MKKNPKDYVEMDFSLQRKINHHFLLYCKNEVEAHYLKGFIDHVLRLQESNTVFNYYRLSPYEDYVYYFHKAGELDMPETVNLYTEKSFFTGEPFNIGKKDIMKRSENEELNKYLEIFLK